MLSYLLQEVAETTSRALSEPGFEEMVTTFVLWLKIGIEAVGAIIIGIGAVSAIYSFVRTLISPEHRGYHRTRLLLSRYLAIALEFQLAADILGTAIAPGWTQLGKLGAIALIRTFLNYFLGREIKEEEERLGGQANKVESESAP